MYQKVNTKIFLKFWETTKFFGFESKWRADEMHVIKSSGNKQRKVKTNVEIHLGKKILFLKCNL